MQHHCTEDLEAYQQDVVVGSIKCCGQVEQGEYRQVAVVDCIQNASQYFQHSRLSRVMCPVSRLQAWQKVCRRQVTVQLPENDTLEKLGHQR